MHGFLLYLKKIAFVKRKPKQNREGHCSIPNLLSTIPRTNNSLDILPSARMYLQRLPRTFSLSRTVDYELAGRVGGDGGRGGRELLPTPVQKSGLQIFRFFLILPVLSFSVYLMNL